MRSDKQSKAAPHRIETYLGFQCQRKNSVCRKIDKLKLKNRHAVTDHDVEMSFEDSDEPSAVSGDDIYSFPAMNDSFVMDIATNESWLRWKPDADKCLTKRLTYSGFSDRSYRRKDLEKESV